MGVVGRGSRLASHHMGMEAELADFQAAAAASVAPDAHADDLKQYDCLGLAQGEPGAGRCGTRVAG